MTGPARTMSARSRLASALQPAAPGRRRPGGWRSGRRGFSPGVDLPCPAVLRVERGDVDRVPLGRGLLDGVADEHGLVAGPEVAGDLAAAEDGTQEVLSLRHEGRAVPGADTASGHRD